jgi:poly(A) polymerase Pap1
MKYYYKIFVNEGAEKSLKHLKVSDDFVEDLLKDADFNYCLNDLKISEFYISYDIERLKKGKSVWTWAPTKDYYKVNWNYKGEIHPERKEKINKLKQLWQNEENLS